MDPRHRGPDWMKISPAAGSLFHEKTQRVKLVVMTSKLGAIESTDRTATIWTILPENEPERTASVAAEACAAAVSAQQNKTNIAAVLRRL